MKQLPYTTEEEPLKEPTMEDLLKEVDTRCIIMDPDRPPRIQPGITLLEVNTDLRKIVYKMSFERRDGMVREVEPPWSDHNSCSFVGYLSLEHYRDEFQEQIFDSVNLQHSIGYPKPLFFDYTSDGVKTSMSTKSVARRRARGRSRGTPNDNRQPRHWPTP